MATINGTVPRPNNPANGGELAPRRHPANSHQPCQPDIGTSSLDLLQSKEQQQLLNRIDKLRGYGISDFISLPQLVVCGDQSSGKSSVLEAITEVSFPRKDTLCTRFATQIVLRRSPINRVFVKILPGNHRTDGERRELALFGRNLNDFKQEDLPGLIESATAAMGIRASSGAFSRDVLSIEISGPDRPQLTIVDLPGLIHTECGAQTQADVDLVSEICDMYMLDPRTIILAVVTAKNDYANQVILKRARHADKDGTRTMGIITKPDMLPAGSESEAGFISLAKNEDINLYLGWHVMRNRGFETRTVTFAERNRAEEAFFDQGVWKHLPRDSVGVTALRSRLSKLLLDHIKKALPTVFREIKVKLEECKDGLAKLGVQRVNIEEQRLFLTELGQEFFRLCKAATDGFYEDEFFGDARSEEGYEKRLRAVIQNSNRSFSKTMRIRGHRMEIVSEEVASGDSAQPPKPLRKSRPEQITRTEALEWVKTVLSRSRGRELPGTFNPLLVGELFWDQSAKWKSLAQDHVDNIWGACQRFVRTLLKELTTDVVFESLFTFYLDEVMESRLACAKEELQRLLVDQRRHAMTYNHYCTDTVRKAREKRRSDASRESIMAALGVGDNPLPNSVNPQVLLNAIPSHSTEAEMDMYACVELLDYMTAYYTVSLTGRTNTEVY